MTDLATQSEVVRLRGLGYSFDSIAATLEVSKPTVMKVCKGYATEIDTLQAEQITSTLQDATEGIQARSRLYTDLIKRLYSELATRNLTIVSTDRLMAMLERAERSLAAIELRNIGKGVTDLSNLSNEDLAKIAAAGVAALPELA